MTHLDFHQAVTELGQAVAYLHESGSPKVGITGGCMVCALVCVCVCVAVCDMSLLSVLLSAPLALFHTYLS